MDFYKVLNVGRNATTSEIKQSFRKLALTYHPDMTGNDKGKTEKFAIIKKAYETLGNDSLRNKYDIEIGNRRVQFRTSTTYSGPTTTTSTHTYTHYTNESVTWKSTVTRSTTSSSTRSNTYTGSIYNPTSSNKTTSSSSNSSSKSNYDKDMPPYGLNMEEWRAWHYMEGDNTIIIDAVTQKRNYMSDLGKQNNKHYQYYQKKNARERELHMQRIADENRIKQEELNKTAAANLHRKRTVRQQEQQQEQHQSHKGKESQQKQQQSSENSHCCIQ